MMSDTVLQIYCLACRGKRKGHILTATVMKKPVTTNEALLSFFPPFHFFFFNQHGMPVSMQDLLGKLLSEEY
jgi:hypothetical protein